MTAPKTAQCQSRINGLGEMNSSYPCPKKAKESVEMVCVHEHITVALLCATHIKRVEKDAQCPMCAMESIGELRHLGCRLRILQPSGVGVL